MSAPPSRSGTGLAGPAFQKEWASLSGQHAEPGPAVTTPRRAGSRVSPRAPTRPRRPHGGRGGRRSEGRRGVRAARHSTSTKSSPGARCLGGVRIPPGRLPATSVRPCAIFRRAARFMRRGVAEFIGTFALIFVGAGSALYGNIVGQRVRQRPRDRDHGLLVRRNLRRALQSGRHLRLLRDAADRADAGRLLLGRAARRRGARRRCALKWIFGTIAGVSGQESVNGLHLGAPSLQGGISSGQGVMIEAILTFFLVLVVFATAVDPKGAFDKIAGLAIGLTITFGVLMAGGLTGGSAQPGPRLRPRARRGLLDERLGLVRRAARRRRARGRALRGALPRPSRAETTTTSRRRRRRVGDRRSGPTPATDAPA